MREDLRDWFGKGKHGGAGGGGWDRYNTKGERIGKCAREPGEPKPKCLSKYKASKLSKSEIANAVRRKRKKDSNPERSGSPIFVKNKVNESKNKPTNSALWARSKALAKSKFKVWPSAYAAGWASKHYKSKGGGWRSVKENIMERVDINTIAKKHGVSADLISTQIKMGTKVEMEHTDSKKVAERIATDHVLEDPRYYTKLRKVHLEDVPVNNVGSGNIAGVSPGEVPPGGKKIFRKLRKRKTIVAKLPKQTKWNSYGHKNYGGLDCCGGASGV